MSIFFCIFVLLIKTNKYMNKKYLKPEMLIEQRFHLNLCLTNGSNGEDYEDMGEFDEAIKKEGLNY